MKHHLIPLVLLCAVLGEVLPSPAAVPLRWTVETSRLQPAVFDVVRGETLNLEAAFQSYGKPLSMAAKPCAIFYQTNGMGSAWWAAPATVRTAADLSGSSTNAVTNVVAATFSPAMDPGAAVVHGFLGSTGDIYRAAFTLRYRHGPGETPNALPIPPQSINWANVANVNADSAPFVVKGGSGGLTPENVTNIVDTIVASSNLASVSYVDTSSATTLASANDYTTTVSNDFHVAVTNLDAVKRDLTNNVCAVTTYWSWTFSGDIQSGETYEVDEEEGTLEYEGKFFYRLYINGVDRWNDGYFDKKQTHLNANIDFESTRYIVCNKYKTATSGQPFVTYDNVPSTNGLCTASVTNGLCTIAAAQAMTNDATIVRGDFDGDAWDIKVSYAKFLTNQIGWSGIDPSTTPTTISGYAITDAYTKAQTETASTNAATSVVSNYLDYALAPLSGTTVNLASGEIGNLSLTSAQTALTVNLDFSANIDRSGDCMLYLVNEADTDMTVGPSSVITIGWDGADIKAGTNVVMFTRMKREGDNSLVMVSTKEIK